MILSPDGIAVGRRLQFVSCDVAKYVNPLVFPNDTGDPTGNSGTEDVKKLISLSFRDFIFEP